MSVFFSPVPGPVSPELIEEADDDIMLEGNRLAVPSGSCDNEVKRH